MKKLIITLFLINYLALFADYQENFNIAGKMYKDGFLEEAVRVYNEVIEEARTTQEADEALFRIGLIQIEQGKNDIAETTIKRHLSGYPNSKFAAEALTKLGEAQYKLERFSEAEVTLKRVLELYPRTDSAELAGYYLSSVYLKQDDYNTCIVFSNKLISEYGQSKIIPQLLYNLFLAYLKNNMRPEALDTFSRLASDYSNSDSRWNASLDKIDYFTRLKEYDEASLAANDALAKNPPRKYEEKLIYKLVEIKEAIGQPKQAYLELVKLLNKFNNSEKLDYYLIKAFNLEASQNNYAELTSEKWEKVFKESKYKSQYYYLKAEMHYKNKNYEKAEEILAYTYDNTEKEVLYKSLELQAKIYESKSQYKAAINNYTVLINEYNEFGRNHEYLYRIGNIFLEKFKMYENALRYFEQAAISNLDPVLSARIIYKIASCYEMMMKYEQALAELNQINTEDINDVEFKQDISSKKRYLEEYKITNYQNAFNSLLVSLNDYLKDDNNIRLKENMAAILADDLKEYDKALALLDEIKTNDVVYRKLSIKIQKADKFYRDGNVQEANSLISEINSEAVSSGINKQSDYAGIDLSIKLLKSRYNLNVPLAEEIYNYVVINSGKVQKEMLSRALADYYSEVDRDKEVALLKQLYANGTSDNFNFLKSQLRIADYYYERGEKEVALNYYRKGERLINSEQPDILYHYAESLLQAGFEEEAMINYTFLINNTVGYHNIDQIIRDVASYYRMRKDNSNALYFLKKMPDDKRDSKYYELMSEIYSDSGDKVNAMESLMMITEKSEINRLKLGQLQYQNKSLQLAEFTLEELSKSANDQIIRSSAKDLLCKIYFQNDKFKEAAAIAQDILNNPALSSYNLDFVYLAKVSVISYYRLQNRPKAEENQKNYKRYFDKNIYVNNEIELNEALYYIEIDPGKAESLLSKLAKKIESDDLLSECYFWRGVSYLKQKDYIKARADFNTVAQSNNQEYRNRANLKLGTISFTEEKFDEALNFYYSVITADSTGELAIDAASNFALVCKTIHEWQKAINAYELILERWGDKQLRGETLFDIAFCYYRDKKFLNAISTFNKALPLLKDNELKAEAQYWIGDSYFENEDYTNSISEFLKVSYNYPELTQWAASADLQVGQAYYKIGKTDQSKYIYNKVIDKYGAGSDWGKEAKKRLETLF